MMRFVYTCDRCSTEFDQKHGSRIAVYPIVGPVTDTRGKDLCPCCADILRTFLAEGTSKCGAV